MWRSTGMAGVGDRWPYHAACGVCGQPVIRKRIEEVFGWGKEVAGLRRMRLRGLPRVRWAFTLRVAAYNLVRLPKLLETG